ncbi:zinc-dependent metalloprotease [Bifidobacterium aquikefiri]|uniref:zinc-dependent metalloprotease n=1 Tax=Bifidobacterium aquikefiri TaxID=1653207 RepID=UPI0023F24387|nr:zinc-dependent metalloprotease [Bifidobacterium aquikefiri]
MDENAIHQWLIQCFGPVQGEAAWAQFSQLPNEVRDQILSQGAQGLPKPEEVQSLIKAFSAGGLNTTGDVERTIEKGPVNTDLAKSIASSTIASDGAESTVTAEEAQTAREAISASGLWLDAISDFNPASGEMQVLTRDGWLENTIAAWAQFSAPVVQSMNDALSAVFTERFGDSFESQVSGMFAGPVPIPIPDNLKDPGTLMKLLGNTSFSMQLGQAAGKLAKEIRGSFDQGIALQSNPAGALIPQNIYEYAQSLELDVHEVMSFLALREQTYARLYASVPWLMPRFEALIGKYARGITIDLDAMEDQLRDATDMNPESIAGAVNLTNVGASDTPEQREALHSLADLLALVEGWVDCVVWRAGMAHIPHIEQLREMIRRERAVGGPAEQTFESLIGLELRPKRLREASQIWEQLTAEGGQELRDSKWSHPDLLPSLPSDSTSANGTEGLDQYPSESTGSSDTSSNGPSKIDWDAELSKLLNDDHNDDHNDKPDKD